MNAIEFDKWKKEDPQYGAWVSQLRNDHPKMFKEQIDMILYAYKSDPMAYRKDKQYLKTGIPTPSKIVNKGDQVIDQGSFKVYSIDDPDMPPAAPPMASTTASA